MAEKSFCDILKMITNACGEEIYRGSGDLHEDIVKCATQIYIAQMNTRTPKERGGEKWIT